MKTKTYLLIMTVPIEAIDDPAARETAMGIFRTMRISTTAKLREVFENKPPRNVVLSEMPTDK